MKHVRITNPILEHLSIRCKCTKNSSKVVWNNEFRMHRNKIDLTRDYFLPFETISSKVDLNARFVIDWIQMELGKWSRQNNLVEKVLILFEFFSMVTFEYWFWVSVQKTLFKCITIENDLKVKSFLVFFFFDKRIIKFDFNLASEFKFYQYESVYIEQLQCKNLFLSLSMIIYHSIDDLFLRRTYEI